jgi:hypothetical protein
MTYWSGIKVFDLLSLKQWQGLQDGLKGVDDEKVTINYCLRSIGIGVEN